jgi:uncharacterized protein (DUF433 family)
MAIEVRTSSWIEKNADVCGGRACIRRTRITVWGLVNSRRLGASDAEILQNIAGIKPDDLDAAWNYYRDHRDEIDDDIRENEKDLPV